MLGVVQLGVSHASAPGWASIQGYRAAYFKQVGQRACDMRVTFDKPPIEVNKSQKDLYIIDILGSWLVLNYFDLIGVYLNLF